MAEVRRVDYFYVTVPDAPGEGRRVFQALADQGVNLLAVLAFPTGDGRSQIDLVPEDAEVLQQAASRAGLSTSPRKQAFLVQGEDRVGAMAEVAATLADAQVNVTAAAAVAAGGGRYGMLLWVAPADYEKAAAALGV
ncbi:MAG: ACT domain-containing protein [Acidothermus sp.]|nr:ACT domain-containing protein [Acidothermus sp.]MCL6537774.1 ACT domain-containing protein [Acidothermus sp.]